jgi:AcrR family transcriptional regulator
MDFLYVFRYTLGNSGSQQPITRQLFNIEQPGANCSECGGLLKEAKVPDRRIQRTRKLLQDALFALILEKGYEAITVQDIIDRANVGRSTFYAHFLDKQQLFLSGFEEVRVLLAQQHAAAVASGTHGMSFSLGMFEHVQEHLPLYRALVCKPSGAIVVQQIQEIITGLVRDELAALSLGDDPTPIPQELVVQYTASAFMGLLIWWADHEAPYTPAQMDAIFQQLTLPGVLAGLGRTEE